MAKHRRGKDLETSAESRGRDQLVEDMLNIPDNAEEFGAAAVDIDELAMQMRDETTSMDDKRRNQPSR